MVLERWLCHEHRVLVNGTGALMEETPEGIPAQFLPWEGTARSWQPASWKGMPTGTSWCWHSALRPPVSRTVNSRTNSCCLQTTRSVAICHSSLNGLRHLLCILMITAPLWRVHWGNDMCAWLFCDLKSTLGKREIWVYIYEHILCVRWHVLTHISLPETLRSITTILLTRSTKK